MSCRYEQQYDMILRTYVCFGDSRATDVLGLHAINKGNVGEKSHQNNGANKGYLRFLKQLESN